MRYLRGIYLIARREYLAYVAVWGFWISLITTPLLLIAVMVTPLVLRQAEPTRYLAVLADNRDDAAIVRNAFEADEREAARDAFWAYAEGVSPNAAEGALAAFDSKAELSDSVAAGRAALDAAHSGDGARFSPPARRYEFVLPPAPDLEGLKPYLSGAESVGDGPLFAVFVIKGAGGHRTLDYWSLNLTDQSLANRARGALAEQMLREALAAHGLAPSEAARLESIKPEFRQFDPRASVSGAAVTARDRAPFIVAIGLSFVLWSAVLGVANMLLTGVLEEKSNKILDALMTSLTPLQILTGKLIGVACVSLTLFLVWGVVGAVGLSQAAQAATGLGADLAHAALNPQLALTFLVCFAAGYLMYGAAFLGLGALCDSLQEAQTLLGPIFILMTFPILLIAPAFENPKSPLIIGASWFPPFSPFLMMMRVPAGLSLADMAGPIVLMLVSLVVVLIVAARAFRAGISHQVKLADLLPWRRKRAI